MGGKFWTVALIVHTYAFAVNVRNGDALMTAVGVLIWMGLAWLLWRRTVR